MDRFRQMEIFIRVAERGNFSRAAEALAIPRATVSTEIQALEDRLKTQLLLRTTRRVSLTPDGRRFLKTARDIVDTVAVSEQMFIPADLLVSGRLRVDVPSRVGSRIVLPALPDFLSRYPDLAIDLSVSDQLTDLVAEGVDCALRLGVLEDSELICRTLGDVAFMTCASPAYLSEHGIPGSLGDLGSHFLVNYTHRHPASSARLAFQTETQIEDIEMRSTVAVDSAEAYIAAALSGLGLIQVPAYDVEDLLQGGQLVEVLPRIKPPSAPLSFLFAKRRNLSPRVRIFQDWLEEALARAGVLVPAQSR